MRPAQAPARHDAGHWKHKWKKRAVTWARWSHIYLSMVSFAILFFFAATGLTLNHQDWFAKQQRTMVYKGTMDRAWLGKEVAQLRIVEQLRQAHGIKAGLGDLRVDDEQISVNFKGPGYTADAVIDRANGSYDVTETRMGWGAVINDLHKGRDAGRVWGMVDRWGGGVHDAGLGDRSVADLLPGEVAEIGPDFDGRGCGCVVRVVPGVCALRRGRLFSAP